MLKNNFIRIFFVIFSLMLSLAWSGNRFEELEKEGRFCQQCILFHTIAYPDSATIYQRDLKEFIRTQTFGEIRSRVIGFYTIDTSNIDIHGFALYMVVPLCWEDEECKELLWQKRYGKDGEMSFEMYRAIALLLPHRLPELVHEFKKYPLPIWHNYSLTAISFLSLHPKIDVPLADSLKAIVTGFNKEWEDDPEYPEYFAARVSRMRPNAREVTITEITNNYFRKLESKILLQKERKIYAGHPVLKHSPLMVETIVESLIHDENWDRICPEIDTLIASKRIWTRPETTEIPLPWLIQHKCGTISQSDSLKLRRILLGHSYPSFCPLGTPAIPVIFKLLREYTQELLAEQKKKNPIKWRLWPEIVKPIQ
jgi:hypothetical protein